MTQQQTATNQMTAQQSEFLPMQLQERITGAEKSLFVAQFVASKRHYKIVSRMVICFASDFQTAPIRRNYKREILFKDFNKEHSELPLISINMHNMAVCLVSSQLFSLLTFRVRR